MAEHKEQNFYRLLAGLLVIAVIVAVTVGYYWREAEQRGAAAAEALVELEGTGTAVALEATTSAEEVITMVEAHAELERRGTAIALAATTSAGEMATAQAKDAQVMAEQATAIAAQATTLAESEAGRAEQQARLALARCLAAESTLVLREGGGESLSLGALLALESTRQYPTAEGDRALRAALSLMSPLEFQLLAEGDIRQIGFDPGGRWIAAASPYASSVTVWELATGKRAASLAREAEVSGITFALDGSMMATIEADGTARLWETGSWKQIARLAHDTGWLYGPIFNPEGTLLATQATGKGCTSYVTPVVEGNKIIL